MKDRGQCVNHPDRPAWSRGLCRYCYQKQWKSQQPPATCHPDRIQYHSSGLCERCYLKGREEDGGPNDWELIRDDVADVGIGEPRRVQREARRARRQFLPGERGEAMRRWLAKQPPASCHPSRPRYHKASGLCHSCYKGQLKDGNFYRLRNLKANYGAESAAMYARFFEEQGGVCAICRRTGEWVKSEHLCVDHDHKTGVIRGLLCNTCNRAIGMLGDDPETIQRAGEYLARAASITT